MVGIVLVGHLGFTLLWLSIVSSTVLMLFERLQYYIYQVRAKLGLSPSPHRGQNRPLRNRCPHSVAKGKTCVSRKVRADQPKRTASIFGNDMLVYTADNKEGGAYKTIDTLCSSIVLNRVILTMGQRNGA